ncbi:MAG: M48 family metallopeptidase, partial [Gemmatimonadota bacterium]
MSERVDFYARQARNRRWTWVLIFTFIVLVTAVGAAADLFLLGSYRPGAGGFPIVSALALGFASLQSLNAYFNGDRAVLGAVHARPLQPMANREERELLNIVTEMSLASGLTPPKVYVIDDPAPNAFATGRDPDHASIGVTRGLLDVLDREQTQGVIAHEMAHIRNYDIRTMTLVAVLFGVVVLISDWSIRGLRYGGGRSRGSRRGGGGILAILALVFIILAPIVSRLVAMAVSRQREYLADASGAEFTRNPAGLARALEEIRTHHSAMKSATRGTAHLFIHDPLERKLDDKEGAWANLWSTHPPVEERIRRLRAMAYT